MKSILDPAFRYVSADKTDLRETFARVRREQEAAAAPDNVKPIKRATRAGEKKPGTRPGE